MIIALWIDFDVGFFWRDQLPLDLAYYRDAARAIAQGQSPYVVAGYLYPPLLARAFVPLLGLSDRSLASGWAGLLAVASLLALTYLLSVPCRGFLNPLAPTIRATDTALHYDVARHGNILITISVVSAM